jgi:hypothetical protein
MPVYKYGVENEYRFSPSILQNSKFREGNGRWNAENKRKYRKKEKKPGKREHTLSLVSQPT